MPIKACRIQISPKKTYGTPANVVRAVEKVYGPNEEHIGSADIRYLVVQGEDLRWFPVFIGTSALRHGAHFKFCTVT